MPELAIGMKIYDNDWYLKYGLHPEQAADRMRELGVNFVITQSRYLPMQDNAVASSVTPDLRARYAELDDLGFRKALRDRGIDYFCCLNVGFDPIAAREHREWLSTDQHGRDGEQVDWYVGIPPDRDAFIDSKIDTLAEALDILEPDGVHLGFARWPGFWETWLPERTRMELREFGFDDLSLKGFNAFAGLDIAPGDAPAAAARIFKTHREAFTAYKCATTRTMIARFRQKVHARLPGAPIAINTLPFFVDDFDGAVREILGQDVTQLHDVVDLFEVMAYHQILKRDAKWPAAIASDIAGRSRQKTICTLQANAHYTGGMHALDGRADHVAAKEIEAALDALVAAGGIEAVCFFTFTDFLEPQEGEAKSAVVRHHFGQARDQYRLSGR